MREPSAGAMRAAIVVNRMSMEGVASSRDDEVARIIDRESGLAEAVTALRATGQAEAPCDNPRDCGTAWGVCVPCMVRAALAKIEGRAEG